MLIVSLKWLVYGDKLLELFASTNHYLDFRTIEALFLNNLFGQHRRVSSVLF